MQEEINLTGQRFDAFALTERLSAGRYLAKHDDDTVCTARHEAYPSAEQLKDVRSFFKKDQILLDNFFTQRISNTERDFKSLKAVTDTCAHLERIKATAITRRPDGYPYDILVFSACYGTLQDYIREKGLLTAEALRIARNLLNGLQTLHDADILHGNINSESVLCGQQNSFVLGNFSVVRPEAENLSFLTASGTNPYMPPETLTDAIYDKQSEVYALGMVIYMLFNNNHFPFGNAPQTIKEQLNGVTVPLPTRATEALGNVLIKALSPRETRYKTALAFFEALENIQSTMDTTALSVPLFSGTVTNVAQNGIDVIPLETPLIKPSAVPVEESESNGLAIASVCIGILAILCVLAFGIWWISSAVSGSGADVPEKRVSIVLSEDEVTIHVGRKFIIPLTEIPEADRIHLSCESTDPEVASVTDNGEITALSTGETEISILQDDTLVLATVKVTVTY